MPVLPLRSRDMLADSGRLRTVTPVPIVDFVCSIEGLRSAEAELGR